MSPGIKVLEIMIAIERLRQRPGVATFEDIVILSGHPQMTVFDALRTLLRQGWIARRLIRGKAGAYSYRLGPVAASMFASIYETTKRERNIRKFHDRNIGNRR